MYRVQRTQHFENSYRGSGKKRKEKKNIQSPKIQQKPATKRRRIHGF
jgi:hypothetical protein